MGKHCYSGQKEIFIQHQIHNTLTTAQLRGERWSSCHTQQSSCIVDVCEREKDTDVLILIKYSYLFFVCLHRPTFCCWRSFLLISLRVHLSSGTRWRHTNVHFGVLVPAPPVCVRVPLYARRTRQRQRNGVSLMSARDLCSVTASWVRSARAQTHTHTRIPGKNFRTATKYYAI